MIWVPCSQQEAREHGQLLCSHIAVSAGEGTQVMSILDMRDSLLDHLW